MRSRTWEGKLLTAAVLLIIAAGLVLLAASKWNGGSPLLVLFLLIAAAILAAAAVGILAGVIEQFTNMRELNKAREAAAWERAAPEVVRLESYTALVCRLESANETVLQILMADPRLAQVIAGNFGPVAGVNVKDGVIPYGFLDEWWAANKDRETLIPVNQWPTTGGQRQYASWLERHLIDAHILARWGGNRTASWASESSKREFLNQFYGERIRQISRPIVRADDDGAEEPA